MQNLIWFTLGMSSEYVLLSVYIMGRLCYINYVHFFFSALHLFGIYSVAAVV